MITSLAVAQKTQEKHAPAFRCDPRCSALKEDGPPDTHTLAFRPDDLLVLALEKSSKQTHAPDGCQWREVVSCYFPSLPLHCYVQSIQSLVSCSRVTSFCGNWLPLDRWHASEAQHRALYFLLLRSLLIYFEDGDLFRNILLMARL